MEHVLRTGQGNCWDTTGTEVDCAGTGHDGEERPGLPWPEPRFVPSSDATVDDRLTGLVWPRDANAGGFPLTWAEALGQVRELNALRWLGHADWRLPNRRELRSLVDHGARRPALPPGHPFVNAVQGWYWTSTTSAMAPGYAWRVHLEGGRMFYGAKSDYALVWPVRGDSAVLARTGQERCFDDAGNVIACTGTGQDGALRLGAPWPVPRFTLEAEGVRDALTGIVWSPLADLCGICHWRGALDAVAAKSATEGIPWRLPTINELESLVDASRHSPALPAGHPFTAVGEAYWSGTTSFFEPDWAYVLYLHKGAVGVGYKPGQEFLAWAVIRA